MSEKKVLNGYIIGGYACAFAFSLLVWGVIFIHVVKIGTPLDGVFTASIADTRAELPFNKADTAIVKDSRLRAMRSAG